MRIRLARLRNEDEDSVHKLYTLVTHVLVPKVLLNRVSINCTVYTLNYLPAFKFFYLHWDGLKVKFYFKYFVDFVNPPFCTKCITNFLVLKNNYTNKSLLEKFFVSALYSVLFRTHSLTYILRIFMNENFYSGGRIRIFEENKIDAGELNKRENMM